MNLLLSDHEFDGLLADEYNDHRLSEKTYMQRLVSIPRWEGRPWRLQESFIFKPAIQTCCMIANVTGLVMIALTLLSFLPVLRDHTDTPCGLATDSLLGDSIGWEPKTMESELRFIEADPDDYFDSVNSTSIWNEIYPSAWIWVSDPLKLGFGGGVKLVDYTATENPSEFDDTTEGFSIAVMHQLHCVAQLKRSLIHYRRDGVTRIEDEHLDHCVEYLRQAVMCHGDLTLEKPEDMTYPQSTTGWGEEHQCRDWNKVSQAVRGHALWRGETGWKKRSFAEFS